MSPEPERQMFVRLAREVERVGIGKLAFVAVGGGEHREDHFSAGDRDAGRASRPRARSARWPSPRGSRSGAAPPAPA